jgi:hypothetical protein
MEVERPGKGPGVVVGVSSTGRVLGKDDELVVLGDGRIAAQRPWNRCEEGLSDRHQTMHSTEK